MKILKNIFLILLTVGLSYWASSYFGLIYRWIFSPIDLAGGYIGLFGLPIAYIFILTLLFSAFGDYGKTKYWWITLAAIPGLVFGFYLFSYRIYFALILGVIGGLIGFGIAKIFKKAQ